MAGGPGSSRSVLAVRRWYASEAQRYDRRHPGVTGDAVWYGRLARDRRVLEVGAGTGRLTVPLAGVARLVVAVDLTRPMLLRARARPEAVRPNLHLLEADAAALPLRGPFELVVAAYRTVQHLDGLARARFFASVAAVLAPAGRLAFDSWHGPTGDGPPIERVGEAELRAELAATGLGVVACHGGFDESPATADRFVRVWLAAPATP
jgi:SAM-dependent methyltransferase